MGFIEEPNTGSEVQFTNPKLPDIDRVVLHFDTTHNKLVSWQTYFIPDSEDEMYNKVMQSATNMHGEGFWDDNYYCNEWYLAEGKYLFVGYNTDYWIVAEYFNEAYTDYTEFAW